MQTILSAPANLMIHFFNLIIFLRGFGQYCIKIEVKNKRVSQLENINLHKKLGKTVLLQSGREKKHSGNNKTFIQIYQNIGMVH